MRSIRISQDPICICEVGSLVDFTFSTSSIDVGPIITILTFEKTLNHIFNEILFFFHVSTKRDVLCLQFSLTSMSFN